MVGILTDSACDCSLRVPAIAYWPGVIEPGATNALAQNVDLFPTVRELAGVDEGDGAAVVLDGVSMVPLLRGGFSQREGVIYYPQFTRRDRGLYAAVRVSSLSLNFPLLGIAVRFELMIDCVDCVTAIRQVQGTLRDTRFDAVRSEQHGHVLPTHR